MEHLAILGAFVLFFYLVVRLRLDPGLSVDRDASTGPTGNWRCGYGGRYESRGLADPPTVSFQHNGRRCGSACAVRSPGSHPCLGRAWWRGSPGAAVPPGAGAGLPPRPAQPPKGTRLVRVGDLEFDRGLRGPGQRPRDGPRVPQPAVRWAIANLRTAGPPAGMLISINPERLLVQVDRNLGHATPMPWRTPCAEALVIHDGFGRASAAPGRGNRDRRRRARRGRGRGPAHLQGLRRADHRSSRGLRHLPDAPPPRLLGVRRRLLDLRLQRQEVRLGVIDSLDEARKQRLATYLDDSDWAGERLSC